jgi:hypothetical protein
VLFDSAEPGVEIDGGSLEVAMTPGRYRINTAYYRPDGETQMILHRFLLA